MYIIKRTDRVDAYVARSSSENCYTSRLKYAKVFPSREAAERDRCVENEVVTTVEAEMGES